MTEDLGRYLGAQLVHRRHGKSMYTTFLDRYKQKMDGWKTGCLSLAGTITSVLTRLPVFHMQTSLLPTSVTKEMDKLVRTCIGGSKAGNRKTHLVNWNTICKPRVEGGFGVRRASEMNKALMAKLG